MQNKAGQLSSIPMRIALLCFPIGFLLLTITSMVQKSATFDEPNKLISGYANLQWQDYRLVPDHPPLARMITALPLLALEMPDLRSQGHLWNESLTSDAAQRLFTRQILHSGEADWVLLWGRIPVVVLGVILGCFVFVWTKQLYGTASAILALTLYGLDPNILAHSQLATSDLALTLFVFLSVYCFYRLCSRFTLFSALGCSLSVACAILTKHTGWLTFAVIFLLGVGMIFSGRPWPLGVSAQRLLASRKEKLLLFSSFILVTVIVVYFGIWSVYGFRYRAVPGVAPHDLNLIPSHLAPARLAALLQPLKETELFPEAYLEGILLSSSRISLGHHFFLLGNHSTDGWWYYFLVAFFVKTPLPTLLLLGLATVLAINKTVPLKKRELFLLLPMAFYFLAVSFSGYNLGLRYILPIYPLLFIFIARSAVDFERVQRRGKKLLGTLIVVWYLISSQAIYPHYLAYFNELVGGAENGHKILVDSNLDWGQDLKGLKRWMDKNGVELIGLSYFGTADPRYYRIPFVSLPGVPFYYPDNEQRDPAKKPSYFAVSATNLQGVFVSAADRKILSVFQKKEPIAKIGHSIFIYRLP